MDHKMTDQERKDIINEIVVGLRKKLGKYTPLGCNYAQIRRNLRGMTDEDLIKWHYQWVKKS